MKHTRICGNDLQGQCDTCGAWVDIDDIYDFDEEYRCKWCVKEGK